MVQREFKLVGLHVHMIVHPILIVFALPPRKRSWKECLSTAVSKARKEMCSTQNILRIEETERVPFQTVFEVDPVKPSCLPARPILLVKLVKPYPQNVDLPGLVPQTRV